MQPWYLSHIFGSVKRSYFVAVFLIGVLSVINFSLYTYHIDVNRQLTDYLFFTAKQRPLTLLSTAKAEDLVHTDDLQRKKMLAGELSKLLAEIQVRHNSLLNHTTAGAHVPVAPHEFSNVYRNSPLHMQDRIGRFLEESNELVETLPTGQTTDNPHYRYIASPELQVILVNHLDGLLEEYRHILIEKLDTLFWINVFTFSGILGLLIFISMVIFLPTFKKLTGYSEDLQQINQRLTRELEERQQIEKILLNSEARFRSLSDNVPVAVWLTEPGDKGCTFLNKYWLEFTGKPFEEQSGFQWLSVVHPDDQDHALTAYQEALAKEQPFALDYRIRRNDGRYRWFQVNGMPRHDNNGRFLGYIGASVNISARKAYEKNMTRMNERLEQANQQLQDFAAIASHDLQEPLRKVMSFHGRIREMLGDDASPDIVNYMGRTQNAIERMQTLIQDLLAYSRITTTAQPFESVDLNKTLADILVDLDLNIHEKQASIRIPEALPVIQADPLQMYQLFQNLISNALKYAKTDTTPEIVILAENPAHPDKLSTSTLLSSRLSEYCQIKVEDNGIGFDNQYSEKIFSAFQRLHGRSEYAGTGMGLAICRKIVQRHLGHIYAEGQDGQGSVFYVTLPVKQSKLLEAEDDFN